MYVNGKVAGKKGQELSFWIWDCVNPSVLVPSFNACTHLYLCSSVYVRPPYAKKWSSIFFLEKKKICRCSRPLQSTSPVGSCPGPTQTWRPMQPWDAMGQGQALAPVSPTVSWERTMLRGMVVPCRNGSTSPSKKPGEPSSDRQPLAGKCCTSRAESGQLAVRPLWCGGRRAAGNTFNIFMD